MAILSVLDGAGASKWQSGTIYPSGLVVTSGGGIWVSNAYNINETPGSGHSWDSLTTIDTSGTLLASALDTPSAGTLTIGGTTATAISVGSSGKTTTVQGPLTAGVVTAPNVGCTAWSVLASQSQTSDGTANTFDQWTTGWGGGGTNGAMSFASSTITVTNAGTYNVSFCGTVEDTTTAAYTSFQIWSGGAVIAGGTTTIDTLLASQIFGFCINTIVTLAASATLKIYFASTASSQAITVGSAVFSAERLY